MIGTTTAEVLRAYSYQVAGDWYATVVARKALARTVEPVPVRDAEVLFFTERAVIPAASDSVNASRGISLRRPMRGPMSSSSLRWRYERTVRRVPRPA